MDGHKQFGSCLTGLCETLGWRGLFLPTASSQVLSLTYSLEQKALGLCEGPPSPNLLISAGR